MDIDPINIVRKVWLHSNVAGSVWMPHIYKIGVKDQEKFREGPSLHASKPAFPDLRDSVDWYWTPAVSSSDSRRAKAYPAQRAVWVDCDESYDRKLLESLKPSFMWETSPGHTQAVWLLKDSIASGEFHRDGFIGMLTQALGADKSGVDIGQLLRVPGSVHHKREPFKGVVLAAGGRVWTRGQLLSRVARGLGFSAGLASELGAEDPYGDRSKLLWKFSRNAAELGLAQDLTFKLIKATAWNKWADEPDRLKEDIANAYSQQPTKPDPEQQQSAESLDNDEHDEVVEAWSMATVEEFGPIIRKPIKWVVPGIIPEGGCGLIVSAPKVGKTRVAIEMALGLASGSKPLGLSVRRPIAVGFFSLEDGEHLFGTRLDDGLRGVRAKYHWDGHIKRVDGRFTWEPAVPMKLMTVFSGIDLSEADDKKRLHLTIDRYGLKLVIIDTLSMAIGRSNVSDSKEMNAILKDLRKIARATGCAIMFIHHTRKRVFEKGETIQESILGSTALHAWCDFIMNLVPPSEDSELLRMGVQTKRGNDVHFLDSRLKIIKKPPIEE